MAHFTSAFPRQPAAACQMGELTRSVILLSTRRGFPGGFLWCEGTSPSASLELKWLTSWLSFLWDSESPWRVAKSRRRPAGNGSKCLHLRHTTLYSCARVLPQFTSTPGMPSQRNWRKCRSPSPCSRNERSFTKKLSCNSDLDLMAKLREWIDIYPPRCTLRGGEDSTNNVQSKIQIFTWSIALKQVILAPAVSALPPTPAMSALQPGVFRHYSTAASAICMTCSYSRASGSHRRVTLSIQRPFVSNPVQIPMRPDSSPSLTGCFKAPLTTPWETLSCMTEGSNLLSLKRCRLLA